MLTFWVVILNITDNNVTDDKLIRTFSNEYFQKKKLKRILMWKPHANKDIVENENECLKNCPVKCTVTGDKNDVANVDAVDFHLRSLWTKSWSIGTRSTIQFPKYRQPHQVWIITNLEPPQNLYGDLKVFNRLFNWTRWYRTDATILWPYGFGHKLNEMERKYATNQLMKRNIFKEKTKGIVGRISNCVAPSNRLQTIREMRKYLEIDMQGLCFGNPCGKPGDELDENCNSDLKKYKFYIAFENNNCKDYVTEKYWYSLNRDQIPIVNWKSIDKSLVIPESYINIYDFKDVKSAADFIRRTGENETLYNRFFEWKKNYENRGLCSSCEICKALHDGEKPAQVVDNLDGWVRDDICEKLGVRKNQGRYLYQIFFLSLESLSIFRWGFVCNKARRNSQTFLTWRKKRDFEVIILII